MWICITEEKRADKYIIIKTMVAFEKAQGVLAVFNNFIVYGSNDSVSYLSVVLELLICCLCHAVLFLLPTERNKIHFYI